MGSRYRWPTFKSLEQLLMGCWEGWETTANQMNPKSHSHINLIVCVWEGHKCACLSHLSFISEIDLWTDGLLVPQVTDTFRTGMYSVHFDLSPSVLRSWLLLGQAVVKSNHMTGLSNSKEHLLSNQ